MLERPARLDMAAAEEFYKQARPGLQIEFRLCLEAALNLIKRHPQAYPIVTRDTRRSLVHRFPYSIFYRPEPSIIRVVRVFHTSENPKKWDDRGH